MQHHASFSQYIVTMKHLYNKKISSTNYIMLFQFLLFSSEIGAPHGIFSPARKSFSVAHRKNNFNAKKYKIYSL